MEELVSDLDIVLLVDGLFALGEDDGERGGNFGSVRGEGDGDGAGGHVPGEGVEGEEAGFGFTIPGRHGPGAEGLVADADAGGGVGAGDVEGGEVGHAEVEVVLVGVGGENGGLGDDGDVSLDAGLSGEEAGGGGFEDEFGGAVVQLGGGFQGEVEVNGGVGSFGGGELPGWVLGVVLAKGGGEFGEAVGGVDLDGDGGGLADRVDGGWEVEGGFGAAGEGEGKEEDG